MRSEWIFSVRFLIGCLVGLGLLVYFGRVGISKNIETRVEKSGAILNEIQKMEYPGPEKLESLLRISVIAGARG